MEILLMVMMFLMFILVYDMIKKKPVYRDSPADPNYMNFVVTIIFTVNDINKKYTEESVTLENIFYALNKLKPEEIINYIDKNTKELYYLELNNMKYNYTKKFGSSPIIKSKEIKIKLL